MVPTITIGRDFSGAVKYLTMGRRDAPTDKAATLLFAAGVRTSSPQAMIADFKLGRAANPNLGRAVWSGTLSFNPDDLAAGRLPDEKIREVTLALCRKMDLDKTQLVVFLHKDTDKTHAHILANRVANDGHTISDSNYHWRVQAAAQELVVEFGLTPANGNRPELQNPDRVVGQPARASAHMRQGLAYGLQEATSREELWATLAPRKIGVKETVIGVSFTHEGVSLKGSSVGREFSGPAIDRQLAANKERQAAARTARLSEQTREAEQAIAAIRREEKSIALHKAQAVQEELLRGAFSLRKLRYRYAQIQEAERRVRAYEAQVSATAVGRELLKQYAKEVAQPGRQVGQQPGKVLKAECRLLDEQQPVSAPIQEQLTKPGMLGQPVEPSPVPPVAIGLPVTLSVIQPPVPVPVVEPSVAEVPLATSQLAALRPRVATPEEPLLRALVPAKTSITLVTGEASTSTSDLASDLRPADALRKQEPQLPVAAPAQPQAGIATILAEGAMSASEQPITTGSIAAKRSLLGPGTLDSPLEVSAQLVEAQKETTPLPAMSLEAMLVSKVPAQPATIVVAAPTVTKPTWQYGIIRLVDSEQGTSEERLRTVSTALVAAGASVDKIVPPTPGRNTVAILPYEFDPTLPSVGKITEVLNAVQAARTQATRPGQEVSTSKVQEQLHPWHQPAKSRLADQLDWPEREGQFNQASILIRDAEAEQTRAERIAAALQNAGASVNEIKLDDKRYVTMQVSYHTCTPSIDAINKTLESVNNSPGIELQESRQNNNARYHGAVQVEQQKEKCKGLERGS
jgi:hypothetical protein